MITLPSTKQVDEEVLAKAKEEVPSKNRRYLLKIYKDCFLGKDLVAWLRENVTEDFTEALEYGRKWQSEYKWFEHVCSDHLLENQGLFYRWTDQRKVSRIQSPLNSGSIVFDEDAETQEKFWIDYDESLPQFFSTVLEQGIVVQNMLCSGNSIVVKNRSYHAKTYKDCFIGKLPFISF